MKKILTLITVLLTLSITACGGANEAKKPEIYTTFYALEYITQTLIGDNANVHGLTSSGGDIHSYEPTMRDMENINKADMFIFLGENVEASAKDITSALDDGVKTLEVSLFLDNSDLEELMHLSEDKVQNEVGEKHVESDEHEHDINQHMWILPSKNLEMAEVIKDSLIETYPDLSIEINNNFKKLKSDLLEVEDRYTIELIDNRLDTVIVSHDAYKYLIKYGVTTVPVKDESASKDPTQKEINEIIDLGNRLNINYVLYDENISCKPLDTIKDEIGAERETISNLTIISDEQRKKGVTLIDLFENNLEKLKKAMN